MTAFAIAPLALRRGTLALSPLPVGNPARARLATFAPALVVSMTEAAEMAALGAVDLPDWLAAQGIRWRHFPIADFSVPPEGADWSNLSTQVTQALDTGQRVLLHCRGGLGRSGMVALRLMVEAGEESVAALERLRAARPGAVETPAQLGWATA